MDLSRFPRRRYTEGHTPLEFLPHFTKALRASCGPDGGPNVWIKRDDMLGLTPGGNKTRKLEFLAADATPNRERLATMASALRFNNLKIASSEQAPRVCQGAMNVCGIVGFLNNTPYSVGRHLRDTMSGALMIANERIHQTNASLLLVAKEI